MKDINKEKSDYLNPRTRRIMLWVGVILLALAVIIAVLGVSHAASPSFTITYVNSGNIYTITASTGNYTFANGSNARLVVLSSAGGTILSQNFTGTYTTVLTFYNDAIIEIMLNGQVVDQKIVTVASTSSNPYGDYGIFDSPPAIMGITIGIVLIILVIFWRALIRSVRNEGSSPSDYDPNLGADVDDAQILAREGIITQNEMKWITNEILINKNRGYDLPLRDVLTPEQVKFLTAREEALGIKQQSHSSSSGVGK